MSDQRGPSEPGPVASEPTGRRSALHVLLVVLVGAEAVALTGAAVFLLWELIVDVPTSYATAVAILVITVIAAVWLTAVTVGLWRGRGWARGGAMFWQLVQLAIALGSFQGVFARPDIGWFLVVPAVLVIVLLFARPVVRSTSARD